MRVTVLNRGGLAVFGGHYDPHADEAVVLVRDGASVALTIEYPSAATFPAITTSGLTAGSASVTASVLTATLSEITDGSYTDISATVGGHTQIVRVRAAVQTEDDRYI